MKQDLFVIEELEARFEMEVVTFAGNIWDASTNHASAVPKEACCHTYTCIGGDVKPL